MRKLTIRDEQPADIPAIYALTRAAFAKDGRTNGDEQEIVNALRDDGDLTMSLVATGGGLVFGGDVTRPVDFEDVLAAPVPSEDSWDGPQLLADPGDTLFGALARLVWDPLLEHETLT